MECKLDQFEISLYFQSIFHSTIRRGVEGFNMGIRQSEYRGRDGSVVCSSGNSPCKNVVGNVGPDSGFWRNCDEAPSMSSSDGKEKRSQAGLGRNSVAVICLQNFLLDRRSFSRSVSARSFPAIACFIWKFTKSMY